MTIEDVEKMWQKFEEYKETAEQHEFPMLMMIDLKLKRPYEDLHKNWDEHHGEIFVKYLQKIFDKLGIK